MTSDMKNTHVIYNATTGVVVWEGRANSDKDAVARAVEEFGIDATDRDLMIADGDWNDADEGPRRAVATV